MKTIYGSNMKTGAWKLDVSVEKETAIEEARKQVAAYLEDGGKKATIAIPIKVNEKDEGVYVVVELKEKQETKSEVTDSIADRNGWGYEVVTSEPYNSLPRIYFSDFFLHHSLSGAVGKNYPWKIVEEEHRGLYLDALQQYLTSEEGTWQNTVRSLITDVQEKRGDFEQLTSFLLESQRPHIQNEAQFAGSPERR